MSQLPREWRWSTVAGVGRVDLGRQRHPDWHNGPDMRPYLRVANVFEDRIDTSDLKEMDFSGVFERYQLQPGDVLLNEGQTPDLLGRPAIYRGNPPDVAFTNTLLRFRAGPDVLPEWALVVFRRHMHFGRFTRESRITTNIAHLSATRFKTVEFPIPPLDEQRRIVGILEDHLSRLDAANGYISSLAHRLEALPSVALLRDESVKSARRQPLRALLAQSLANGRSVPTKVGGFPVLRLTALAGNGIDLSQRKGGAWSEADASPFLVHSGDFLVSRGNGSLRLVGRGGLVRDEPDGVAYPDTLIRVRTKMSVVDPEYLSTVWNSPLVRQQIEKMARTTAGIYKVNQKHLESVELPIPDLDEQLRVSARIASVRDSAGQAKSAVRDSEFRASALRRALLAAAFSGRLTGRSADMAQVEEVAGV